MLGFLKLNHRPVIIGFFTSLLLSACGGGGGQASSADGTAAGTSAGAATGVQSGAVALSNLPINKTLSTSAAIAYDSPAAGTVYCRLDSYAAIVCPNPFVLGATSDQALAPGAHTVDYYLDTGSGINLANPTSSYTWTVVAATGSSATPTTTATPVPAPTAATTPSSSSSGSPVLLAGVNAGQSFASMGNNYLQMLGGQMLLSSVSETSGVSGSGTITGPSTLGTSSMRFGKVADPLNPSRAVFYHAAKSSDPVTYGHLGRVEIGLDAVAGAMAKTGVTYWISSEVYLPSSRFAGGAGTLVQVHQSDSSNPSTGPFAFDFQSGDIFGSPGTLVMVETNSSVGSTAQPGISYPWGSDTGGAYGFNYAYPRDQWVKVVCKYRGDPSGNTGLLQVWLTTAAGVTTQIVNQSNIQIGIATTTASDYTKSGLDDLTGGGANGVWELRRSFSLYRDNGNTEPQIRALMQ